LKGLPLSVPMNEVLTATLQAVRMSVSTDGPVLRSHTGKPDRSFCTACMHTVPRASTTDFALHDLRYPFASQLVMSGVDPLTVQALMGHKDISTTLRYTHLSSDRKQRVPRARGAFKQNPQMRGGIMSQANRYLGGFCSSQRIFPPQMIQVLLLRKNPHNFPHRGEGRGQ
jgi:hypothetical protein